MSPTDPQTRLPHHKLVAYQLALELVQLIARTRIADDLRPASAQER
jgi:hypothetical protein